MLAVLNYQKQGGRSAVLFSARKLSANIVVVLYATLLPLSWLSGGGISSWWLLVAISDSNQLKTARLLKVLPVP